MQFPGFRSAQLLDEIQRYVIYDPWPFVVDIEKSSGMWLATIDGQRIFDWAGYYASKLLGHNHPRLRSPEVLMRLGVAALHKVSNPDFLTPQCLEYYRLLHSVAPRCMRNPRLEVYAVNSGAEAVENMMKYMLNLHDQKLEHVSPRPSLRRFIYFDQAFHGRTIFALNVTQLRHDPVVTRDFAGIVPGNIRVPFPALDADAPAAANESAMWESLSIVEDALRHYGNEIVGIIVEPLQGAGGHRVATPQFFRELSALAHRYGVFLGFDEVQTAGGQTGQMFAIDLFDLPHPPAAVATAKKFACGAVYMLHPMDDKGVLDSTWGGSLVDMVRAVEEFRIVREEKLIEQVPEKAALLADGLRAIQKQYPRLVGNVRGLGLYQGFTVDSPALRGQLLDRLLQEESTLLLPAGEREVRLRPPIDVGVEDIRLLLEKLGRVAACADA